jgi:DNA modification methylase
MSGDATAADVLAGRARWSVHHGDALDLLRGLPDASVDAVVTDPPYCSGGVGEASRQRAEGQGLRSESLRKLGWFVGDDMGTAGLVWLLRAMAFEATRLLKPGGSLLVFCDWRMVSNLAPAIESAGLRSQNLLVWDKGAMGLGSGFRMQHELVLHYAHGVGSFHDKGTSNVLRARRVHATEREHQTQKPVDLLEQILEVVLPPGGIVLDPFAGSGTTGVAALLRGRRFVGAERDAGHVATARDRCAGSAGEYRDDGAQPSLFAKVPA